MKTVILCGGIGYRLKDETEFKPKPMVNIGGQPILWHIMKMYSYYGFNEFIIALGYKGDYVKQYFLNQKDLMYDFTLNTKTGVSKLHKKSNTKNNIDNFKITFVDTGQETLPGERILKIKDYIPKEDTDFMVTYGDGVADINIKSLVEFHKKQGTMSTITGVHPRSKYGLLIKNNKGLASSFIEKPVLKEWTNGGFMVFKKEAFSYFRKGEFEHKALKRFVKKKELSIYTHNGFWYSMDTYSDVDSLNKYWKDNPKWKIWKD